MARTFVRASEQVVQKTYEFVDTIVLPFTMACWFNVTNATDPMVLVGVTDWSGHVGGDFHVVMAQGNIAGDFLRASSYATASKSAVTSSGYTANTWHHGCGVFASTTDRRVYLDGGSKGTNVEAQNPANLSHFAIGGLHRSDDPANYVDGRIAEAGYWNVALSDAEVAVLGAGYSPLFVRPENLIHYWPLVRDNDNDLMGGGDVHSAWDLTPENNPGIGAHVPIIYPGVQQFGEAPAANGNGPGPGDEDVDYSYLFTGRRCRSRYIGCYRGVGLR